MQVPRLVNAGKGKGLASSVKHERFSDIDYFKTSQAGVQQNRGDSDKMLASSSRAVSNSGGNTMPLHGFKGFEPS